LVSLNPAAPTAQRETTSATETVAGVTLSARIDPAERGANTVALTLTGSSGAPLEPVSVPEVRVTGGGIGPLTAPVTRLGPGQFTAAVDLPLPGTWQVAIAARVSTYNNVTATLMVVVP
jgi:copper transport protein